MAFESPASQTDCGCSSQSGNVPSVKPDVFGWPARIALVLFGMGLGHWQASQPSAHAQLRKTEQPQAFLSGSERCEVILKDMHQTLQTMDQRLAGLEQVSKSLVKVK